jgi:hypothetical protein
MIMNCNYNFWTSNHQNPNINFFAFHAIRDVWGDIKKNQWEGLMVNSTSRQFIPVRPAWDTRSHGNQKEGTGDNYTGITEHQ